MALLYLFDDDGIAVDEDGWEWEHVDGTWRPKPEQKSPALRLIVLEGDVIDGEEDAPTPD